MIEVNGLTKRFGQVVAVDGISFSIDKGEVVGFLGPNGAGKTTTMRILTGFLRPDEGDIKICGEDVVENPIEVKRRIGYLPEDNPLYTSLTVKEYLQFVAEVRKITDGGAVRDAIEISGLEEVTTRPIGELSKGYRQRVGLAQAILHNPDILIMDEPTSGLDPTQIVSIRSLIKELGKEKTIIISTHILPEVSATCSRVIIIHRGKIIARGTPDELQRDITSEGERVEMVIKASLESVNSVLRDIDWIRNYSVTSSEEGTLRVSIEGKLNGDTRERLFYLAVDNRWVILEMRRERASLEDVFLQLTTQE